MTMDRVLISTCVEHVSSGDLPIISPGHLHLLFSSMSFPGPAAFEHVEALIFDVFGPFPPFKIDITRDGRQLAQIGRRLPSHSAQTTYPP